MKKTACVIIILSLIFALGGCGEKKVDSEYDFYDGKTFFSDLAKRELETPKDVFDGLSDFVYAMDYLAFYRIKETVYFGFSERYASAFYNPYQEFLKAYEASDLADVYPCTLFDDYYGEYKVAAVRFSISRDVATSSPENADDTPVIKPFDYGFYGDEDYIIPIEESGRTKIRCETGEQLYYLAENGYEPAPEKGSVAERLYEEAKGVIKKTISPSMTDFQKIRAIYDYLTSEIRYDRETAYSSSTYLVKEQAYYLEGVFFNRLAVCDGKSKAYALLLNMLGIECYRTTGKNKSADHAWNVVCLDGKYYLSCVTYGQPSAMRFPNGEYYIVPNRSMMLASAETPYGKEWGYIPQKHTDICEKTEKTAYDVFGKTQGGYDMKVNDIEEAKRLLLAVESEYDLAGRRIEFLYCGGDDAGFRSELINLLSERENLQLIAPKSEGGQIYEAVYL